MATTVYDNLKQFREAAQSLRDVLGGPVGLPRTRGEDYLADGLAIYLEFPDDDVHHRRVMDGSLTPEQLADAAGYVRSSIHQSQAFAEMHLSQAVAAEGHGFAAGEMHLELDVARASQEWLMRHGNEVEQKVYGALWGAGAIDMTAPEQRDLFVSEAQWMDAAYSATGYKPPTLAYDSWQTVLSAVQAANAQGADTVDARVATLQARLQAIYKDELEASRRAEGVFTAEWKRQAQVSGVDPDLVRYRSSREALAAELVDFVEVRHQSTGDLAYDWINDEGRRERIPRSRAAELAAVDEEVLGEAESALRIAFHAAREPWEEELAIGDTYHRVATELTAALMEQAAREADAYEASAEAARDREMQENLEAEMATYDPESDPEVIAARAQDPSLNVDAHEADLETFVREYERRQAPSGSMQEHLDAAQQAFTEQWAAQAKEAGLEEMIEEVAFSPSDLERPLQIGDRIGAFEAPEQDALEFVTWDEAGELNVGMGIAADILGTTDVQLEAMEPLLVNALHAAAPHRAAALIAHAEALIPATAADEEEEWTVTPERALGAWIETTAHLHTLLDTGQYTAVRNAVRESDSYLHGFTSGGTPPGSYEEEYLYLDALNRAVVPVPSEAPAEVLRSLRHQGFRVPDFPTPAKVQETNGVSGLNESAVQRALTQPGKSPTPRTYEAVRFAGAWREAMKGFDEGLVVSYDIPNAPGQALVERLDGNLDSYVSAMWSSADGLILDDTIGNRIEPDALQERLGISEGGVSRVMSGLEAALEAAQGGREAPAESERRVAPSTSLTDPHAVAQLPPQGPTSAGTPSWS
ncbi:hypothetical protein GCM10028787_31080 [Brachybacterium horti]